MSIIKKNDIIISHNEELNISLFDDVMINPISVVSTYINADNNTTHFIFRDSLSDNAPLTIIGTPPINNNKQLTYLKVTNNDNVSALVSLSIDNLTNVNYHKDILSTIISPNDTLYYNVKDDFYLIDYKGDIKRIVYNIEPDIVNSGSTIDLTPYSLTSHTHTILQLSGVSITDFNSYTGATNDTYSKVAFGSIYEHNSGGTIISVSNLGTTGWITAITNTHKLTTLTKNLTSDRITILSGGSGTYQINTMVNAKFSSGIPIYNMGIYKNNVLIPQAQSYVSPANSTDRFNLATNTIISNVLPNDFFDIRFTSNNETLRNITVYHITFNINRID